MAAADEFTAEGFGHLGGEQVFCEAAVGAAGGNDVRTSYFLQLFGIDQIGGDKMRSHWTTLWKCVNSVFGNLHSA